VLSAHFVAIRQVHIACAVLSGALFCLRGGLRIANVAAGNDRLLRLTSYVIDTALLAAAVLLMIILQLDAWLTTRVLLLVIYIVLGSLALKRARSRRSSVLALCGALLTYTWIIGVAVPHAPAGWLSLVRPFNREASRTPRGVRVARAHSQRVSQRIAALDIEAVCLGVDVSHHTTSW
jgi:uncharacterized membrane protein SirB2